MHPKMKHIYIGVDCHKKSHTAVIINCWNEKLGEITIVNKPAAFEELLREVKKHSTKGLTPLFGLEDTGAAGRELAKYLLRNKQPVKTVNSSYTYSERKKNPITHKTDSVDAECIAKVLLDMFDRLPNADPVDIYWTLGMLVRRREGLVKAATALKNQLHYYVCPHYPSYRKFFTVFDCKTALAFWERYPSPSKLKGVTEEELGKLLAEWSHNMYSTKKAKAILDLINEDGDTTSEHQEMRDNAIIMCINELKQSNLQKAKIEDEMKQITSGLEY